MSLSGGVWSNSCLQSDGTLKVKARSCTLPQWVSYVREFDERIQVTFDRVDTTVPLVLTGINVDMQDAVNEYMLDPIDRIANGVTCGFMVALYQETIDALCYQGVVGLRAIARSYVACAVLTVLLMILMYGVWRRSIDNVNRW